MAISFMSVQTLFIASAILTKPDLIDKGAEADVLQVLQGKVVPLKKGYTIVRCRGQSDINENVSLAEATRQEKEFFSSNMHFRYYVAFNLVDILQLSVILCNVQSHLGVFYSVATSYLLEEQRATISCLATRLTKELVEHIKASLNIAKYSKTYSKH